MIESNPTADNCHVRTAWGCTWTGIVALVFLRLVVGWHFFSEGAKKFEYDTGRHELKMTFSAEGFFNGAKGPLAGFFQSQAPTTHDWRELLAQPQQMTPEASDKLTAWVTRYVARRKSELAKGKFDRGQSLSSLFLVLLGGNKSAKIGKQLSGSLKK